MMEIVWPNIIGLSRERDVEFFAFATIFHNLYYNFNFIYTQLMLQLFSQLKTLNNCFTMS